MFRILRNSVRVPLLSLSGNLKLTFVAEKPPPAHVFDEVALIAAEESGDYE